MNHSSCATKKVSLGALATKPQPGASEAPPQAALLAFAADKFVVVTRVVANSAPASWYGETTSKLSK